LFSAFVIVSDGCAFISKYGRSIVPGALSVKLETAVEAERWRRASSAASPSPSPLYTDILGVPRMSHYYDYPPAPIPSRPSSTSNLGSSTNSDLLFTSSPASTPPPLPSDQKLPQRYTYTHLPPFIAHQLAKIWTADRRLPTPESRKRWALARDVDPVRVHNWWYRRKRVAKGLGVVIPEGNYELGVGDPVGEKEHWEREREEALSRIEREKQERQEKDKRDREEKEAREEEERKQREEADAMEKREEKVRLRALGKENMKGGKRRARGSTEDTNDSPAQKRVKTAQRKDSVAFTREDSMVTARRNSAANARKASLRPAKPTTSLRSTQSKTATSATSTTATSTKSNITPQPRPHMRLTRRNRPAEWQEWEDSDGSAKEEVEDEDLPTAVLPVPGGSEREGRDDLAASDVVLHPELPTIDDDPVLPTCAGFTTDGMYQLASRDRMPFLCAVCAEPAPSFPIDFDPSHDRTGFDSSLGELDCDTLLDNTDSGTVPADTQADALLGEAVLDASLALFNKMLDNPTLYDEMIPPEDRITMADADGLLAHTKDSGTYSAPNFLTAYDPRSTQSWVFGPTLSYDLTDADFAAPAFAMDALPHARLDEAYPHDRAYIHFDGVAYTRDGFRVAPLLEVVDRYASCSPIPMDAYSPANIFSFVSSDPCKLDPATLYPESPVSSRSSSPSYSCRSSPAVSRSSSPYSPRPASRTSVDSPATQPTVSVSNTSRSRNLVDITNTASSIFNAPAVTVPPPSTAPLDFSAVKLHPNLQKSLSSIISRPSLSTKHPQSSLSSGSLPKCRSLPTRAPLRTIEIIDALVEFPHAMVEPLRTLQAPQPARPYGGVRRLEVQAMDYQGASSATASRSPSTTVTASPLMVPSRGSSLATRMSWLLDAAVQALTGSR
ncbi:hypothetical protein FB107DRAFT_215911, partial [Schizophyllum commune]